MKEVVEAEFRIDVSSYACRTNSRARIDDLEGKGIRVHIQKAYLPPLYLSSSFAEELSFGVP